MTAQEKQIGELLRVVANLTETVNKLLNKPEPVCTKQHYPTYYQYPYPTITPSLPITWCGTGGTSQTAQATSISSVRYQ